MSFKKQKKREYFPTHFKMGIFLMPNHSKTLQENYRPTFLMNTNTETLNKKSVNQIQQNRKTFKFREWVRGAWMA